MTTWTAPPDPKAEDRLLPIIEHDLLDAEARRTALDRPAAEDRAGIVASVRETVRAVRSGGDAAVLDYARRFDGGAPERLRVAPAELDAALAALPAAERAALARAITNVRAFHAAQLPAPLAIETMPGVRCERITRPLDSVGLYVPGGSAPLPSALIMSAIPAALAGVRRRVLCTPARGGRVHPAILATARLCGVDEVFAVGGAQAIAALAYGTETIPKVDKIVGPGSAWVTAAKQVVAEDPQGAALDLPAGPSEVLVIADDSARAEFVAADLLAQAEHDPLSQALLLTPSRDLAAAVRAAALRQLQGLSRSDILRRSLARSRLVVVRDLDTAIDLSNEYAPEHLLLQVRKPRTLLDRVQNAGSVFLGPWSPEPMGDYCSGTNHVLPTYGYARAYSGLSVADFLKRITVQELTEDGLRGLGPTASTLARLEGLDAHALAVDLRLRALGTPA
jgi:histidinol dehydrogenase